MKQKKHHDELAEIQPEVEDADKIAGDKQAEAQATSNQESPKTYTEEEYQMKINELNDKYLRLYSEFDNFRKRSIREKHDLSRTASEHVIKDLLPVLDDFDRALKSMQATDQVVAVKEGVELIYAKMKSIFESKGLKEIVAMGQDFNTDFHEAITSIPAPTDDLKNKVIDEIQKGYMLGDKVIRFSKVVTGN